MTRLLLVLLLATLHGALSFLSDEGEVNAAKFYDALAKTKTGPAFSADGLYDDLKTQEVLPPTHNHYNQPLPIL